MYMKLREHFYNMILYQRETKEDYLRKIKTMLLMCKSIDFRVQKLWDCNTKAMLLFHKKRGIKEKDVLKNERMG